jgi:hypothetical protein
MKYNQGCSYYNEETLKDSLGIKKLNLNHQRDSCGNPGNVYCSDTSYIILFGLNTQKKVFARTQDPYLAYYRTYAKNIGLYHQTSSNFMPHANFNITYLLLGCVIGGVLYGDTSIPLGINQINNSITQFSLSQNCPNPFNPVTKIKFDLPKSIRVKLVVFDILGRRIETLMDENKKSGYYEVNWDGSHYSSGVYIYVLTAGDYKERKKMVLLK